MPFWPWYMLACAVLILMGRDGKWFGPAAVLAGLIAMRLVMTYTDGPWQQVGACAVWLSVAGILAYKGLWLPSIFCATSGIVYPALMLAGLRIDYLGWVAILADLLMLAGLLASYIGGGGGRVDIDSGLSANRGAVLLAPDQGDLATRQAGDLAHPRAD